MIVVYVVDVYCIFLSFLTYKGTLIRFTECLNWKTILLVIQPICFDNSKYFTLMIFFIFKLNICFEEKKKEGKERGNRIF